MISHHKSRGPRSYRSVGTGSVQIQKLEDHEKRDRWWRMKFASVVSRISAENPTMTSYECQRLAKIELKTKRQPAARRPSKGAGNAGSAAKQTDESAASKSQQ